MKTAAQLLLGNAIGGVILWYFISWERAVGCVGVAFVLELLAWWWIVAFPRSYVCDCCSRALPTQHFGRAWLCENCALHLKDD